MSVSDPRRKSVTVDGLQPNREYVLSVSALTRQGPGQATSITIRTRPNCELHSSRGDGVSRQSERSPPLFSARLRPLGRDPHAHLAAAVLRPSAVAPEKRVSHCGPQFPQTSQRPSHVAVFHLPSRVKTSLVGIFAYPDGMNVRAPDLDSFLQEVQNTAVLQDP